MKKYYKPYIEDEFIEIEDICANSNTIDDNDEGEYDDPGYNG